LSNISKNQIPSKLDTHFWPFLGKFRHTVTELLSFITEFRNALLVILIWIVLGGLVTNPAEELSTGFFPIDVVFASVAFIITMGVSIIELILYPVDLILSTKPFDQTTVPEIFILLIPLVILIVTSFLIFVWTED
jgi:hypothetical protein